MNSHASNISIESPITTDKHHTEESFARIAVLFTDIVGSTEFFKNYGDKQGRQMLRHHYNIATSIISRFNGRVLKFIGDSIMASFDDPADALKAAIFLQKKIQIHNKKGGLITQTHIRVGIHYGNVIVGKGDIYGDVVNVASKLTNIAKGDEIYISNEVYEHVKGLKSINFESPTGIDKKNIPEDLVFFRVYWDEDLEFDPEEGTVIFIHPLLITSDLRFMDVWSEFIGSEHNSLKNRIKKKRVFPDRSIAFYIADPPDTIDTAKKIIDMLLDKINQKNDIGILPFQVAIGTAYRIPDEEDLPEWFRVCLGDMNPGYIYISGDAYFHLDNIEEVSLQKISFEAGSKRFYRFAYPLKQGDFLISPFPYSYVLIAGPNKPCFYCGSKGHRAIECPSKDLSDYTNSTEKLGYYTIEEINSLFLKTVLSQGDMNRYEEYRSKEQLKIAYEVFFELTRVYQLRFFRTIWNIETTNWLKIKAQQNSGEGGLIWLAQDSIRVSELEKAESLLKKATEENHDNFRLYCAYGYLCIEKEDIHGAENYFKKALFYTKNSGHKIFIGLLLARLYLLSERLDMASRVIGDIIIEDPLCVDAVYLDIIIKFHQGKESKALQQLEALIKNCRIFFIYAYIDYELFPYRHIIAERLDSVFKMAKTDAEGSFRIAEEEFNSIKDISDNHTVSDIEALFLKIKNALSQDSYFGYLDTKDLAGSIISRCRNILMERRKKINIDLHGIFIRIKKGFEFLDKYRYKRFSVSCRGQLEAISAKANSISGVIDSASPAEIKDMESVFKEINAGLNTIEEKIENLIYLKRCIQALSVFIKWGLFSIGAVMLACFILLPLFAYYTDMIFQGFRIINPSDVWFYQKTLFMWGSISSIFVSFFVSIKRFLKNT